MRAGKPIQPKTSAGTTGALGALGATRRAGVKGVKRTKGGLIQYEKPAKETEEDKKEQGEDLWTI